MPSSSPNTHCGSPSPAGRPPPRPSPILSRQHKSPQIPSESSPNTNTKKTPATMASTMPPPAPLRRSLHPPSTAGSTRASLPKSLADLTPNTTTKKTPATMSSTKGLTHLSGQHKQASPQIPIQPRPAATTTTKKTATTPSTKSVTVQFHIYQPPSNFQGWADGRHLEAPLRHLGLLDVARLQLPTGVPRPNLVSQLIASYDPNRRCGNVSESRVNVDRESFLRAVSLHPTAERTDLPPNVPWSTVTRAAEQFINMCLRVQWRDMSPTVSAAMREVQAGSAHTVDWGKLMWDLIENEILELPRRDDKIAYFGVYLQRLIWAQKPDVFKFDERLGAAFDAASVKFIGKRDIRARMKPMQEMQSSQLGIMLNDEAGLDKSDHKSLSCTPNGVKMHTEGNNDHMEAQQRFQQKWASNGKNCGVPTESAIAVANGSHDIVEIERELKHATAEELREAETFVQVVKLLQEKLSAETIMHMFD